MFGDKKKTSSGGSGNGNVPFVANNVIKGTRIVGSVESEGDIRIDGSLEGTLTTKAKLVVGSTGFIEGDVVCSNAIVEGTVEGKMDVQELLFLKSGAVINGDINTRKLVVEEGARFNGRCNMGGMQAVTKDGSAGRSSSHAEQKKAEAV